MNSTRACFHLMLNLYIGNNMNINFSPWYYRNLLLDNTLIEPPRFYKTTNILNEEFFESNVVLKSFSSNAKFDKSLIYNNCDGSGADKFKNIAIYKSISEALERLAFYESVDDKFYELKFNLNPTTTGMAAFPHINYSKSRLNAKAEAIERWAINEFNKKNIPAIEIPTLITNLRHFELITPFRDEVRVSIVLFKKNNFYTYSFAADKNLSSSFNKSLIELNRNIKILEKNENYRKNFTEFKDSTDRTLLYFSSEEGYEKFMNLINSAPNKIINNNPIITCDKPVIGRWSKYTKVWRYLLDDSYFPCETDHTFFMF